MKKGFTLIEIMIVLLIVGILATLAIPTFRGAIIKVRLSQMLVDVSQLERTMDLLKLEGVLKGGIYTMAQFSSQYSVDVPKANNYFEYRLLVNTSMFHKVEVSTRPPVYGVLCFRETRWWPTNEKKWRVHSHHDWSTYLISILPDYAVEVT